MDLFKDLAGKTALVTGASQGLGRHFARVLAQAGCAVIVAARQTKKLEALCTELNALGARTASVALDLTNGKSISEAVSAGVAHFGHIDILINNAGIAESKAVLDQTDEDWDRVVDTNLRGAFLMAREVARHMVESKRSGSIINISSVLGFQVIGHLAPYAAAKAGLLQLTKAMALELVRNDIRVNAIAPGYIATDMNSEFFATKAGQRLIDQIPMRRLGSVNDLDGTLLLLASDSSRYITGSAFVVDGGFLLK
jgi:3-oxoacyl-[acyl-carrier protein] reductase